MKRLIIPAACLVVLTTWILTGCAEQETKEMKAPLRQVRTMMVDAGDGITHTSFSGRLHALKETSLSFKVSGTIQKIHVKVGDRVKKGEVIASLDPSTYALEAQQSRASLAEAESELRNAKSEYERVKKLYIGGNESRSTLDNARAAADSSAASVQAARKALEIARLNLSYTRLIAEEDCAIASKDAEVGENVSQGRQIFYTTCGRELEVKLDIPETVISHVKKEMAVRVSFPALGGKKCDGMVNEIGVTSMAGGTTYPVTILLTGPDSKALKPGLSADVSFSFERTNLSLVVPPFAVGEDRQGRFVFVLERKSPGVALVKRQPVTIGNVLQQGIEITRGLAPGMRIVTAGVSVLRQGMEVKYNDRQ